MNRQSGVYAINNLATGKSYVGSSVDLQRRRRVHFRHLRQGTHHSVKLQNSWAKHGEATFVFEVLELVPCEEDALRTAEQQWIETLDSVTRGYNVCPQAGNVGRLPKTPEHKAKIGAARRGAKHTPEAKALISARAKGRKVAPPSAEHRAKIAEANRGKTRTPEQRKNISLARQGLKVGPMSDAQKSAIAASKRGKPLSAEHRQRIREGLLARKQGASDAR